MKLPIAFILCVLLGLQKDVSSTKANGNWDTCQSIMKKHGLTERFPGAVSHGIHSITLEDIRYFFKKNATEKNRVPTLNYDLTSKKSILPNAPLYGFDTSFYTIGMQHVDQVMRNMDRKDFYLTKYNTLEKLIHTIHMTEVWSKAKVHYDSISLLNLDSNLCTCVMDVDNNGIMKMLPFMSLKIRYPGITSGKVLKLRNGGIANWSGNLYNYYFFNDWKKELSEFDFDQDMETILNQASYQLVDHDEGIKHLNNEKSWNNWKNGMKGMVDHDNYELAMFLYCALKD